MQLNELVPQAIAVLRTILHNEAASPSVQLRAALAVLKYADAAEEPQQSEESPNPAFQQRIADQMEQMCTKVTEMANVHKPAQQPIRKPAEPGRNSQCPCNSGMKYKRCCANKIGSVSSMPAAA